MINHICIIIYGGNNVTVCERWHCFENFYNDIPYIEGFDYDKFHNHELDLDKDIKQWRCQNKIYSLDTCVFLEKRINQRISIIKPCAAVNINDDSILYSNSIINMAGMLNVSPSLVGKSIKNGNITKDGYRFLKVPAGIVPAIVVK